MHARIAWTIRGMKEDMHKKRMIVGGNNAKYQGDVGTLTTHLETDKLL